MLRTYRLAILGVGYDNVVHGLRQRKGVSKLTLVRPFRNQPTRPFLHAGLVQQHGERHPGPFTATRHPVYVLDRQPHLRIVRTVEHRRTISMTLYEINPGYQWQALELLQGETQRTIDHAMDRKAVSMGIDVGQMGWVSLHEAKW